ncbi:hypothetical protein ANCCAN_12427 [Ancylostoma caninum]|uniref:Uncharacterized protein n=1 Tax=Ancylostoma caninum TaxID=29170 RepID=A0A368GFN5_ANCCA|nr:hypothetical protein ANCCAN_12427 [Ancylostoma caninum]
MEVVEQDLELDHLILHSEATQEDISSESQTPSLFGQVINSEELSLESIPQVEITQDDVSFSECKTPPASPVRHNIQPGLESTRSMSNFKAFDTNSTKVGLNYVIFKRLPFRMKRKEAFIAAVAYRHMVLRVRTNLKGIIVFLIRS